MKKQASIITDTKCINLDWLSVYCIEPKGVIMDASYYQKLGWTVEIQPYGTNIYAEKFKLMNGRHVFLEIERNPYSLKKNGGIFEDGACHIRLSNRTCYQENAIQQLQDFILRYKYEYKGISRIDICCDFVKFDNGMYPQKLANEYMADKFWKVHQSTIYAHTSDGDDSRRMNIELGAFGKETKKGRSWNSLKWGSTRSPISTKMYNKSLELSQNSGKFYIKDMWVKSGLIDLQKVSYEYKNPKDGRKETRTKYVSVAPGSSVPETLPIESVKIVDVWRVEFSISTEGRHWVDIDRGKRINLDLCAFTNVENRAYTFYVCAEWLFCFVYAQWLKKNNGEWVKQRTNRCKRLQLFNTKFLRHNYKPQRQTETEDPTRTEKLIMTRLMKKAEDKNLSEAMRKACVQVAYEINRKHRDWFLPDADNPFVKKSLEEIAMDRENEELRRKMDSAPPDKWMMSQDDSDSLATLNKNANAWKLHKQKQIQAENAKMMMYYNILKRQVERVKELTQNGTELPKEIEEILGTPF